MNKKFDLQKSIKKVKKYVDLVYKDEESKSPEQMRLFRLFNKNFYKLIQDK